MEAHKEGTTYGDSYRGYNVWRLKNMVQCMETHIEVTMYGDSYRGHNVRRLIERV